MHISRLIIIAEMPSVMMISLKNGTAITVSLLCVTGFCASSLAMKIKSKKAILQMIVSREKKEITFIENNSVIKNKWLKLITRF